MDKTETFQVELPFPILGLDITKTGFDQRNGTSPLAVNVRGYDRTGRLRGSSRPGLNPWFGAGSKVQVNGFNPIQHLAVVVTATQLATFNASVLSPLQATVNYSESDHPPPRNAPQIVVPNSWIEMQQPTLTIVTAVVVGTPDGGGTGQGTATFKFSTDGTTVTIVGTFVSAGFPPPVGGYFYAGPPQVVTKTISQSSFFPPGTGFVAFTWTVVDFDHGYIGNYDVVFRTF